MTFLASVNEVISCQTYLATQDFSNSISLFDITAGRSPVIHTVVVFKTPVGRATVRGMYVSCVQNIRTEIL